MAVLTRADLDDAVCDTPGCDHTQHDDGLYLHAACHPQSPLKVLYMDGVAYCTCATCDHPVAALRIAETE